MKELSIEEKAKAYDEALKVLHKYDGANMMFSQSLKEEMFPELKESEDERIRKVILDYFKNYKSQEAISKKLSTFYGIPTDNIIAWLEKQGEKTVQPCFKVGDKIRLIGEPKYPFREIVAIKYNSYYFDECIYLPFDRQNEWVKQGEQKPADKVEPKFKVGDWVVNKFGDVWHIDSFDKKNYQVSNGDKYNYFPISKQNEMHLWTIQDAKDGDVLFYKGIIKNSNGIKYERICLFNNLDNAFFTLTKTSNHAEEYDIDVNIDYPDNTVPATKEQKEILFMVMKEAGYEWNAEKKELTKIKLNPAWSEEDDEMLDGIIEEVRYIGDFPDYPTKEENELYDECLAKVEWLKSLKDRVQPKQGEQKPILDVEIPFGAKDSELQEASYHIPEGFHAEIDGNRVVIKRGEQILANSAKTFKDAWSEDDEVMIESIIQILEPMRYMGATEMKIEWLKILKERYIWKPSKEQITWLYRAADDASKDSRMKQVLNELLSNLKKLIKE